MKLSELRRGELFPNGYYVDIFDHINEDSIYPIICLNSAILKDEDYEPFRSISNSNDTYTALINDEGLIIAYTSEYLNSTIRKRIDLSQIPFIDISFVQYKYIRHRDLQKFVDDYFGDILEREIKQLIIKLSKNTKENKMRKLSELKVGEFFFNDNTIYVEKIKYDSDILNGWPVKGYLDTYRDEPYRSFPCVRRRGHWFDVKDFDSNTIEVTYYYDKATYFVKRFSLNFNPYQRLLASKFIDIVEEAMTESLIEAETKMQAELNIKTREEELQNMGREYKPSNVIINEPAKVVINVGTNNTITDKFTTIIGSLSSIVDTINAQTSLGSQKELADAFVKAKLELVDATEVSTNFVTQYLSEKKWFKALKNTAITTKAKSDTVKKNIDSLFGLMHEKYNTLISVAESLQQSLAVLEAQVVALKELSVESDNTLSMYEEQHLIPTRELAMNNQIKAAVLKYQDRIVKVKGSITAMQATIVSLGRDLPAHKADLEDEMAISGLLSNVDDYQQMFTQIKELVTTVTDSTRAKTFTVVDNLMKMQIEDTHTVKALQANINSGSLFAKMLSTHADTLANKAVNDAKIIKELSTRSYQQEQLTSRQSIQIDNIH